MWMATHDRIQCGVQLKKKKWSGPEECFMCGILETSDRILFQCPITMFLWSFMHDCLGQVSSPISYASLFFETIEKCRGKKQVVTVFLCAGALWSVQKTRNDVVFNKKILSSSVALIYKTVMVVKTWSLLLKPKLKPVAEDMIQLLSANAATMKRWHWF